MKDGSIVWSVSTPWGGGGCLAPCGAVFEPATRTEKTIAGRMAASADASLGGHAVQFDVRFRADVKRYSEPQAASPREEGARTRLRAAGFAFSRTDYFRAAEEAPEMLEVFKTAGMPVDAPNPATGRTMLMASLQQMQDCDDAPLVHRVSVLITMGADPNQMEDNGGNRETALMKAYPCLLSLSQLIDAGARLDTQASWTMRPVPVGRFLMDQAIDDADSAVAELLIKSGFDVKPDGAALLKKAAGKAEILAVLRAAGAKGAAPPAPAHTRRKTTS
jgi:hypothetical protein